MWLNWFADCLARQVEANIDLPMTWQTLDRVQKPLIATKLHQNWQLSLSENQPTKTKIMISAWCVDWCDSIAGCVLWLNTYPKFEDENCKHRLGKRTLNKEDIFRYTAPVLTPGSILYFIKMLKIWWFFRQFVIHWLLHCFDNYFFIKVSRSDSKLLAASTVKPGGTFTIFSHLRPLILKSGASISKTSASKSSRPLRPFEAAV
jgi:hypothetical protein